MFIIDPFILGYKLFGYKIIVYPLLIVILGGISWGIIVNQLPEIYSFIFLGIYFGFSYGIISKLFGFERYILPSLILTVLLILCLVLTLFAGLYFGAYFIPIIIGNMVFSLLLFMIDHKYFEMPINIKYICFYLFAALFVITIIYFVIIIDWKKNILWLYLFAYPLVIYIYIQISIVCRLDYR